MWGRGGLGLISSSNFYVPQVNLPGSMAAFIRPAAIPVPVPVSSTGGSSGLGLLAGLGQAPDILGPGPLFGPDFWLAAYAQKYWPWIAGGVVLLLLLSRK